MHSMQRVLMPDSEVLVDKIVKLQRLMAKRQEKLDFMEEHISTLLEEVKKKNKIVQHYVMKAETGALVSTESDRNKVGLAKKKKTYRVFFFKKKTYLHQSRTTLPSV